MLPAEANPAEISNMPQSIGKTPAGLMPTQALFTPQEIAPDFCDRKISPPFLIGTSSFYIRFAKITVL
jgi:hypothetical protein